MSANMTSCRAIQPDLVAAATGDASPTAVTRVQQHVDTCAPCRQEMDRYRSIDRIVIGKGRRGPVAETLQHEFFGVINGTRPDEQGWLSPVYAAQTV